MTVVISDNLKKESVQINMNGDEVIPFTKKVIKKNEASYVPTKEEIDRLTGKKNPESSKESTAQDKPKSDNSMAERINALVEAKIKEKVDKIVEERVNEALKNI